MRHLVVVLGCAALAGCGGGVAGHGVGETFQAAVGPVVSTDKPTYAFTDSVVVNFAGSTTDPQAWVALAAPTDPDSSYHLYQYTGGTPSGMLTFSGIGAQLGSGTFVARLYGDNTFTKIAESPSFTVAAPTNTATVSTDKPSYAQGENVVVSFTNMSGSTTDWISVATAGSNDMSYVTYQYTGGALNGMLTFANLPQGSYVARAYFNNSFNKQAESTQFTIGPAAPTVSSDHASYLTTDNVVVSWTNTQGHATDWVSIAPQGSGDMVYIQWVYTAGMVSGNHSFGGLAAGTYVARLYYDDNFTKIQESAAFTISAPTSSAAVTLPGGTSYTEGAPVTAHFTGLQGTPTDWIAIAPPGSPDYAYATYQYTGGATTGDAVFAGLPAGTWVARAYNNNTLTLAAESVQFSITPAAPATVSSDKPSYASGENVVVSFTGLQGTPTDWIAIAAPGSADIQYVTYMYTNGAPSGSVMFSGLAPGTYEARAYNNNSMIRKATSMTFTVGP